MNHSSILLFNWNVYGIGVGSLTLCTWAIFFFYDYFIHGQHSKESMFDNPSSLGKSLDMRTQIQAEKVEFDSMINH